MSTKYGATDRVPTEVLAARLDELSIAVTQGKEAVSREFTMRIPAEMDRDADLVLSAAAKRLLELEQKMKECESSKGNAEANRRLYKALEDCQSFLKDGETPAECIARNRADLSIALGLLAQEKQKNELLPGRAKAEGYY